MIQHVTCIVTWKLLIILSSFHLPHSAKDVQLGHCVGEAVPTGEAWRAGERSMYPQRGGQLRTRNHMCYGGMGTYCRR